MKIISLGAELMYSDGRTDGRTDGHDEARRRFSRLTRNLL